MRRSDREIKNKNEIIDVIKRAATMRLGIHDDPFPYVVPLSYGYEEKDGDVIFYFHGANEGKKHTLLDRNNCVCVEIDIFHRYSETETGLTTEYESVIGFGAAELVYGDEAIKAMNLICTHCGYDGYKFDIKMLSAMRMYKVTVKEITGKRRFV